MLQRHRFVKIEFIACLLFAIKGTVDCYPRARVGRRRPILCDMLAHSEESDYSNRSFHNCTDRPEPPRVTPNSYAYCISNGKHIPKGCICDGKFDCEDLSDEYLCTMVNEEPTEEYYDVLQSLLNKVNDSRSFFPPGGMMKNLRQYEAPNAGYLKGKMGSDENALDFLKGACVQGLQSKVTTSEGQIISPCDVCESRQILCSNIKSNHSTTCVNKSQVCDGISHCPDGADERYCEFKKRHKTSKIIARTKLNQTHIITTCESLRMTMKLFIERMKTIHELADMRNTMPPYAGQRPMLSPLRLRGISHSLLSSKSINRLQFISSNKSLALQQICDRKIDCDGGFDEMICPRRFYCQSGDPLFVNSSAISNGLSDCADGSDEWVKRKNRKWSLASKDKMVKDWYVLCTMWIVGISATFGNSIVICKTLTALLKMNGVHPWSKLRFLALSSLNTPRIRCKNQNSGFRQRDTSTRWRQSDMSRGWKKSIRIWDSVFILNLATADFLMGIYLIVLGSVSLSQTTKYWEFDNSWRTSLLCQSLGVLAVLSSQASVFTLVGLTTLRLSTVIKPFGVLILRKTRLLTLICCAIWTMSFLIAVFPILPQVAYGYASEAWVPLPHVRPNIINLTIANDLLRKAVTFSNNITVSTKFTTGGSILSWDELIDISSTLIPAYSDWKFFGYYSAHSVCLPKLFVSIGETAWEHTVVLLSVNLVAFLYICCAYVIIYRLTIRSRSIVRNAYELGITRNCCSTSLKQLPGHHKKSRQERSDVDGTLTCPKREFNNNTDHKDKHHYKRRVGSMHKMQFRIALLVTTDFLCWIPICIMGFLHLFGFDISNTAYTVSAIGLLPVNSALNPILYSNCLWAIPKSFCRRK